MRIFGIVLLALVLWVPIPAVAATVKILPPIGEMAPGGTIIVSGDVTTPGTAGYKANERASTIVGIAMLFGSEEACSFKYDAARITEIMEEDAPSGDKKFHADLLRQIAAVKKTALTWSASGRKRICGEIVGPMAGKLRLLPSLAPAIGESFADFTSKCRTSENGMAAPCAGTLEAAYAPTISAQPDRVTCDYSGFWAAADDAFPAKEIYPQMPWATTLEVIVETHGLCKAIGLPAK